MNYFLMIVIIGIAGFAYYQHNQDETQVTALQQQISDLQEKAKAQPAPAPATAVARPVPMISPEVHVIAPQTHSPAIDEAAHAATVAAATNSNNVGSITTLDGRTFQNCKVLKVESDGVTFSHDEGITKILYPFLPPDLQKQFGYDPQKAVTAADAEVRYAQEQAAAEATTNAPTTTAPQ